MTSARMNCGIRTVIWVSRNRGRSAASGWRRAGKHWKRQTHAGQDKVALTRAQNPRHAQTRRTAPADHAITEPPVKMRSPGLIWQGKERRARRSINRTMETVDKNLRHAPGQIVNQTADRPLSLQQQAHGWRNGGEKRSTKPAKQETWPNREGGREGKTGRGQAVPLPKETGWRRPPPRQAVPAWMKLPKAVFISCGTGSRSGLAGKILRY